MEINFNGFLINHYRVLPMNLNQLKLFYLTAKYQSPTAAAKALFITQPAVTTGIQRFEDYYDIRFFTREGKKMVLTKAGKALYGIAEKIFEMEVLAEDCVGNFQEKNTHQITIHTSESFGAYYLPSLIDRFSKTYPDVKVSVEIMLTDQVVDNTIELKNDLGFISYPIKNRKLIHRKVVTDRFVIITSPDHKLARKKCITPIDLFGVFIIMHEKSSAIRKALIDFVKAGNIAFSTHLELSNNEAIKRVVELGTGVALISKMVAAKEVQRKELVAIPLSDPSISRKFYMVHHRGKFISKPLHRFLDMMDIWATDYDHEFPENAA
jgi:DNA-binding transcriptional LysR family regulator